MTDARSTGRTSGNPARSAKTWSEGGQHPPTSTPATDRQVDDFADRIARHVDLGGRVTAVTIRSCALGADVAIVARHHSLDELRRQADPGMRPRLVIHDDEPGRPVVGLILIFLGLAIVAGILALSALGFGSTPRSSADVAPSSDRAVGTMDAPRSSEAPSAAATSTAGSSEVPPTSRPSPSRVSHETPTALVVRGKASTYGDGWDGWIAWPDGPGWRLEVCGAGGCETVVSNDAGPSLAMQREGRIIDLDVPTFESVCAARWRVVGLCPVTVTVLGRA